MSKRARVKGRATRRMSSRNRKASTGFIERGPESEALIRSCEVSRIEKLVDRKGLVATTEAILRPNPENGGRMREVPLRSLLIVVLLNAVHGANSQFTEMVKTATRRISGTDQYALGLMDRDSIPTVNKDHFRKMFDALDDRLNPKHYPNDPAPQARLFAFINSLTATSLPDNLEWSGAQSIDATAVKAWGIGRRTMNKDKKPIRNRRGKLVTRYDPDAAWGHATDRGQVRPKSSDGTSRFYGYDAHFACSAPSVGGSIDDQPELVTSLSVVPASTDVADAAIPIVRYLAASPYKLTECLADRAYTYKTAHRWQDVIRRLGAEQVLDLHSNDQGARDSKGAQIIAGRAHCACTPEHLATIRKPLIASDSEPAFIEFRNKIQTREQYEAAVINNKPDGSQRVQCPALAGKVACPHRPETMGVASHLPIIDIGNADLTDIPMCSQVTTTIPAADRGKLIQKESWGSKKWTKSYARRSGVERKNSFVKDTATGYIQRGKWKVKGLVKNAIMVATSVFAHNYENVREWARKREKQAIDPLLLKPDPIYKAFLSNEEAERIDASRSPPTRAA